MQLETSYPSMMIAIFAFLCVIISSFVVYLSLQWETLETGWKAVFTSEENSVRTGEATDFHFFLEDERGQPIEDATVTAVFDRVETIHQIEKRAHPLQSGLYATEVIFSVPGTWMMMIHAKNGNKYYKNQFLINVIGPIIAKKH